MLPTGSSGCAEADVEVILQRTKEKHPAAKPRIISDNGPQFIARDFKEFIRILGMTHVRTSPYYPQSNGKIERWHKRLHHAEGRAGGASAGDPCRTRPQVGSRQRATPESPPASRVKSEAASRRMWDSQGKLF
jgi:transposase InsO family protein